MDTRQIVLDTSRRLFEREAQTLYKLGKHPQIPELLAHFEWENEFYLAQEYVEGVVLNHEIKAGRKHDEAFVRWLLNQVLGILQFVHSNNVIHRDIKPSNLIKRKSDGNIVLIDFGAVKEVSIASVTTGEHTSSTVAVGSPGYMPDEQANGRPKFSSDIFALGVMGVQALTGVPPQQLPEDPRTGQIIWQNLCPSVDKDLAEVLNQMIRPHFSQRFTSAEEVLSALGHRHTSQRLTVIHDDEASGVITTFNSLGGKPKSAGSPEATKFLGAEQQPSDATEQLSEHLSVLRALGVEEDYTATLNVNPAPNVTIPAKGTTQAVTLPADFKKRSSLPLLLTLCLGLAGGYGGWRYWQGYQLEQRIAQESKNLSALLTQGKLKECVDQASSYEIEVGSNEALQSTANQCRKRLKENDAKRKLDKAKQLAKQKKFVEAIAESKGIEAQTLVYTESQTLSNTWADQIIKKATTDYQEQGKLKEATNALKQIPSTLPNGKRAVDLVTQWEKEWKSNEKVKQDADKAVKEGRWQSVLTLADKASTPYWKKQLQPLKDRANVALTPVYTPPPPPPSLPSYSDPGYSGYTSSGNFDNGGGSAPPPPPAPP
jgi:serine/threonine-protein kinase